MSNLSLGSLLAVAIATAGASACGSGEVASYENCAAVSQYGDCLPAGAGPGGVCEKACDCLAQLFPELGDVETCVAECIADPEPPPPACVACVQHNTCEVIFSEGGPCEVVCDDRDMAGDPPQ